MTQTRPPVITVLGHVDHGKTTLLDAVRKTSVAAGEAGGITQKIGASVVVTKEGKRITFIDTPGHAAFTKMRSRGADVADIAILVVGADDGVKPQTQEALQAIRDAQIPFIVAVTKIDLPSASVETVVGQLEKEGVVFEGRGGDTPVVPVSAKIGKGIDELIETILLVSEVHELKGDEEGALEAVVIETSKDKRGPLASAIVKNGTLKVGDEIFSLDISTKVRGLFNSEGKPVKAALPSDPVLILGFDRLPSVGSVIKKEKEAVPFQKEEKTPVVKIEKGQIPVSIKAQNAGSLEAILGSLPKGIAVIDSAVGDVNESDILHAKASGSKYLFAFESKLSPSVAKLAESEAVRVETFKIIYELFDRLNELIKGEQIEILGKAEIVASFPFNSKKIAGCKMREGRIGKTDSLVLVRGQKELGKVRAVSLKKQKQEISEAKSGEEFGILFEPQLDFEVGDMLVSVRK